ncbi:MAG: molecular chaperone HtpG [Clostridia bacterium]|nr:molecular chaperone HtpG [Clostridia bacterium]
MQNEFTPKNGGISVETEHIFPVIKKWLYSEKEIFLRELVSNACDAVTKLKRLASLGQFEEDDEAYRITVTLDKDEKTLSVTDNGIGMSAEELEKYICNIALSGAMEFIEQYEKGDDKSGIIGHFGLGFYSAFMVADTVEVWSKSYTDAPAVHWTCDEAGSYTLEGADDRPRGTSVVLHLSEEGKEYLDSANLRAVLDKYCAFMPVAIFFEDDVASDGETKKDEEGNPLPPEPVNDTQPLWMRPASECTEEEYKAFYHQVFGDFREPLFWIHLNADYPLNFKGILYFPPLRSEYDNMEGQVKLYYNQVFVADNIKEVIPEYLLMLRGVLDCPELPLNVSRSYLQNSGYVSKISAHIVKKVADKLNALFNTERETYEGFWNDIKLFVEYGCLRDRKFYDRVAPSLLLPLTEDGKFETVDEALEAAKETHEGKLYYANDKVSQAQYISLFEERGIRVYLLSGPLEMQYMSLLEDSKKCKFLRIDADIADALKGDGEVMENATLAELFKKVSGNDKLKVTFETLADEGVPALLNLSEQSRRYEDMMRYYSRGESFAMPAMTEATLVLNANSPLIRKLAEVSDDAVRESAAMHIWSLSLLSQRQLTAEELKAFLKQSYQTLGDALENL